MARGLDIKWWIIKTSSVAFSRAYARELLSKLLQEWMATRNQSQYVLYKKRHARSLLANMKKALRERQTPRAGCSKARPNIFAPPQAPFPGARDGQNLIGWRWSLPAPTNPVWRRVIVVTDPPTHKHTHPATNMAWITASTSQADRLLVCSQQYVIRWRWRSWCHQRDLRDGQTGPITIHCAAASAQCKNHRNEAVTSGYQYYKAEVAIQDHGLSETSQFYSLWSWTFRAVRLLALVHAAGSLLYNLKVNKPREKNCLQYFDAADQTPGMTSSASKT